MRLFDLAASAALLAALLAGCGAPAPAALSTPTNPGGPTPRPPIENMLREAYRVADPAARLESVLSATGAFLLDEMIRQTDDTIAASYYSSIAFSSGQLTRPEPARLARHNDLAVIALPEGLGLYLYELDGDTVSQPQMLSRWTLGIESLRVTWQPDASGVAYSTRGGDNLARPHFILIVRGTGGWQSAWNGDEVAGWWFNAEGGVLTVAEDLSWLEMTGPAEATTDAFYELSPDSPRRTFRIRWHRQLDSYEMVVRPDAYGQRREWLWQVAEASPYATLVEFVERMQVGDEDGAAALTTGADVVQAAEDFGLTLYERRFQVASMEEDRIVFRDVQGTLVALFSPPEATGAPWCIRALAPLGAEEP
jgi:hypothetical protein